MEKYSLLKLTGFTNGQLSQILANELGFKGSAPDPKAADYRMRMIDLICDLQDGKKPAASSFVVKYHFSPDNVNIYFSHFSSGFVYWFNDKIETKEIIPQTFIDLSRTACDNEIIAYIGSEAKAEVTLSGIYEMLKCQPCGGKGDLLTGDNETNIFYVRDTEGDLCPVCISWNAQGGGWEVDITGFDSPKGWKAGDRVFYS